MPGVHQRIYFCNDCLLKFSIMTRNRKITGNVYCPHCGDCISVKLKSRQDDGWTEKDVANLIKHINNGLSAMKIAAKLGRTYGAVTAKAKNLRKTMDLPMIRKGRA